MNINSIAELLAALKTKQNKYGIVGGLNPDKDVAIFKFLVKLGLAEEYFTPSHTKKRRLNLDKFNEFLAKHDMYCEVKGVDVDKTMLEYLKRFGAVKDGVLDYYQVFAPNERVRIEEGDPLALEQKAMRKKLTRLATLCGKSSREYIEQNLGLTISYSDIGKKYGHSPEDAKKAVVDFVSKKKSDTKEGRVTLTKGEKSTLAYMLKYHNVEQVDSSLSPIVDVMFNEMGVVSNDKYRERVENYFDELVEEIIDMWPDGIVKDVTLSPEATTLYNRMKNYYYNMPHSDDTTFTEYWSMLFATTPKLNRFRFVRSNNSPKRVENRQALVDRALTSDTIYVAPDGTKHMQSIFKDRKNYNILRKEALLRGLTLEQYMLEVHGIILDQPRGDTLKTNTTRLRDSSSYERKPVEKVGNDDVDDKGSM